MGGDLWNASKLLAHLGIPEELFLRFNFSLADIYRPYAGILKIFCKRE